MATKKRKLKTVKRRACKVSCGDRNIFEGMPPEELDKVCEMLISYAYVKVPSFPKLITSSGERTAFKGGLGFGLMAYKLAVEAVKHAGVVDAKGN